jgi:hypothetical protein
MVYSIFSFFCSHPHEKEREMPFGRRSYGSVSVRRRSRGGGGGGGGGSSLPSMLSTLKYFRNRVKGKGGGGSRPKSRMPVGFSGGKGKTIAKRSIRK